MICAVCSTRITAEDSAHYAVGPLHGRVCLTCQEGLSGAVGRWLVLRTVELNSARWLAEESLRREEREERAARKKRDRLAREQAPRGLRMVNGGKRG